MNPTLEDEVTSINSIYDGHTLQPTSSDPAIYTLRLPTHSSTSLRIQFPPDYPDAPPAILGTQSVGDDVPKGFGSHVVQITRDVLARVYRIGEPCVFDLTEEVGEALARQQEEQLDHDHDIQSQSDNRHPLQTSAGGPAPPPVAGDTMATPHNAALTPSHNTKDNAQDDPGPEPPWTLSTPATEKKSVFLARAAPATSPAQARASIRHLLATDRKVAKATHNITAWRIRGASSSSSSSSSSADNNLASSSTSPSSTNDVDRVSSSAGRTSTTAADIAYQDCDSDGETAAGGRVLHLLRLMGAWDVVVVVSRWYGGVQLGPDRFRIINAVAREAVVRGGFVREGGGGKGVGKEGREGRKKGRR